MKDFLKIFKFIKPHKRRVALNFFFNFFSALFSLFSISMVIPFLNVLFGLQPAVTEAVPFSLSLSAIKENISFYFGYFIQNFGSVNALVMISVLAILASLLKNGFKYLALRQVAYIRNGVAKDIRQSLYEKSLFLPMSFYARERKGNIISRMTNDVNQVELSIISSLEMVFREPITILVFLLALLALSPDLSFFVLVLLPASAFVIARIARTLRSSSYKGQSKLGAILSVMEESISGLRVIKAFNAENKMKARFGNLNNDYTALMNKIYKRQYLASPLSELMGTAVVVAIMIYGGTMIVSGNSGYSASTLIGYLLIFSMVINPAKYFSQAYYNIQKGLASVDRIQEIFDAENTIVEVANPGKSESFEQSIALDKVCFKYEEKFVINNVDLRIHKGEVVALVGHSGAGKSTLVDLLLRFHDTTTGDILIDGVSIRNIDLKSLRNLFGYVNQDPILFNDTVFNNIAFGQAEYTQEEVVKAAKIANAHHFIMNLPEGYNTTVGDSGSKLSGGERQRISIARAVLKNPPVLILDEATSALDTESEKLVQEAIYNVMKNRTVIVIAHRLSTITYSNTICVLQDGEIVEQGSHKELLKKNGVYKKLNDLQLFA